MLKKKIKTVLVDLIFKCGKKLRKQTFQNYLCVLYKMQEIITGDISSNTNTWHISDTEC